MSHLWRSDVELTPQDRAKLDGYRAAGAVLVCLLFALDCWRWHATFLPFWLMNTAIHESGHAIFGTLTHNDLITLVMGNGWETLFPLIVGIWFLVRRRDWVAFAICMAWVADTLVGAAVYIADAPVGALPLIGIGSWSDAGTARLGDWAQILGPEHLDKLYLAAPLASDVRHVAVAFMVLAFATIGVGLFLRRRALRAPAAVPTAEPLAPVTPEQMWR